MCIHFTSDDWTRVKKSHAAWWRGELDRPLIQARANRSDAPKQSCCAAPLLSQANCTDFSHSPEALIERYDEHLSQFEYYGDAYPLFNFHVFGPGVAAAFCGAELNNDSGSVWFFPPEEKPIEEISIRYNPESIWVQRIKALYRAGGEKWQGNVLMSMPDLGGVMDIVATFVGTENLLLALYDAPEEVKRLTAEAHTAFMQAYKDLSQVLREVGNPCFSDWDALLSEEPSYVLQSDFSYMIGPDMFAEFVYDDLQRSCSELVNVIYHMDGIGQLPHLPQLLTLKNLKAIQWVQGDGQPSGSCWSDVYRQILQAGMGCQVIGSPQDSLTLLKEFPRGLYLNHHFSNEEDARRFLSQAGVPIR